MELGTRLIFPHVRDALFKGVDECHWQGRVQVIGDGRECIPFVVNYKRYMMEFEKSGWLIGNCGFEESLFKDQEDDYFLSRIDHRIIFI